MLFSNLRRVRPPAPREPPRSAVVQDRAAAAAYPPAAPGIPACAIEEILASHEELIGRIKLAYGADRETFERDLLSLVRRYAAYVHLLPATPDNYFSGPGGLFRFGLEVAFHALQATDGHIFSGRSTIAVRSETEPRWRHASFIAGLCCELHRTLGHLLVTDATGEQWPAYLMPLHTWLAARKAQRYCVKWLPEAVETRSLGVFALPHIVPAEILQHLAHDNALVVPHLMASISGMALHRDRNVLDHLVRRAAALVIDRDLVTRAQREGKPLLGAHLAHLLLDAMRRLVADDPAWRANAEKSRVWFAADGLFILWPSAAADIIRLLEADQLRGMPQAPETLLEILVAAGIIEPRGPGEITWPIQPPQSKTPVEAIKLSVPESILTDLGENTPPLSVRLAVKPAQHSGARIGAAALAYHAQAERAAGATRSRHRYAQRAS